MSRLARGFLIPLSMGALLFLALREPILFWLRGHQIYDDEAVREWLREANAYKTLPELVREHRRILEEMSRLGPDASDSAKAGVESRLLRKRQEILEHLKALGNPPTKLYPNQLLLFPVIYRLSVAFDPAWKHPPIVWDSDLPRQPNQYRTLEMPIEGPGEKSSARALVQYHLHAFQQRQSQEGENRRRNVWLFGLGVLFSSLLLVWTILSQRRQRDQERKSLLAEQQVNQADRLRLQEELLRQEAERKQQEAERQTLELRSQLFANIGIMAGSYAHNIKNLLVRPNDLIRRCLESPSEETAPMLHEVQQTLGTVTERLQQILQTVRRDPSQSEKSRLDLNHLAGEMARTWGDLARDKWKMTLELDLASEPLPVLGDHSNLQQALENLVFNARDATFEMRNHLRDQARVKGQGALPDRQALIAAAGWKGHVVLRTRKVGEKGILEIQDNGIGMTEEVRKRCAETHFSTKRDNALFAGLSAGMGLGLSFVTAILAHHQATLEIESKPREGSLFRVSFPLEK